jgi:hypothetical protein
MHILLQTRLLRAILLGVTCLGLTACGDRPGDNVETAPTLGPSAPIPPLDATKPDLQLAMIIRLEGNVWAQYLALQQGGAGALRAHSATFFEYDSLGRLIGRQKRSYAGGTSLDNLENKGTITEQDGLDYDITEPNTRTEIEKQLFSDNRLTHRTLIEEEWEAGQLSAYVESIYSGNESLIDIQDYIWTHYANGKPQRRESQRRFNPLVTSSLVYRFNLAGELSSVTTDQGRQVAEFRYGASGDWTEASLYDETGRLVRCLSSETGWVNGIAARAVLEWDARNVTSCSEMIDDERALLSVESRYYIPAACHPANFRAQAYLTPDNHYCTPRSRWSDTIFE